MYREIEIGQDNNMRMHWLQFETHVLSLYAFACFLPHNSVVIFKVYPKKYDLPMFSDCKLPPFRSRLRSARWNSSMRPSTCQFLGSHGAALVPRVPLGAAAFQHRCSRRKPLRWKKKHQKTTKNRNHQKLAFYSNEIQSDQSGEIIKYWSRKVGICTNPIRNSAMTSRVLRLNQHGISLGPVVSALYDHLGPAKNHPWNSTYTDVYRIINFNWGWLVLFSVYPTQISR